MSDSAVRELIMLYSVLSDQPERARLSSHHTMQQSTASSASAPTPEQIRRRLNDFDYQIRQGLEDGSVRSVMKRLSGTIVSSLFNVNLQLT